MARYTFRRLSSMPTQDDGWIRVAAIDEARSNGGEWRLHHAVLRPGGRLAEEMSEADTTVLFTVGGRGALRIERDRIEVQTNEMISIPPGCPFAMETVGGTNWVFLRLEYRAAS